MIELEHRKLQIEVLIRATFRSIKIVSPDLYGFALSVVSKLDEEDWQQQAKAAGDRRERLNGRRSRYADG